MKLKEKHSEYREIVCVEVEYYDCYDEKLDMCSSLQVIYIQLQTNDFIYKLYINNIHIHLVNTNTN